MDKSSAPPEIPYVPPPRYDPLGGFLGGQKRRRRLMLGFTLEMGLSTVGGHNENRGWGGVQKPNVLNYVRNQTVTMRPEQASCLRRRSYVEFANLATIWPPFGQIRTECTIQIAFALAAQKQNLHRSWGLG